MPCGLTKDSSDGPAATPSRLRDFQSRSSAARALALRWSEGARRRARRRFRLHRRARLAARPDGAGRLRAAAPSRRGSGRPRTARRRARGGGRRRRGGGAAARRGRADRRRLRRLAGRCGRGIIGGSPRAACAARTGSARGSAAARPHQARARSRPADRCGARTGGGGGAGRRRASSAKEGRGGRGGGSGMAGSAWSNDVGRGPASASLQAASGSGAIRGGCGSPSAAGRGGIGRAPASRARYWARPRCRSGRRSSADARHCRAGPAPGGGGHPRRRRRSRPAAASVRGWVLAPRRLLAKRRTSQAATPISARTAMNAKRNVSVCILDVPGHRAVLTCWLRRVRSSRSVDGPTSDARAIRIRQITPEISLIP